MPAPLRVLHVITGLGLGGAERQLASMVSAVDPARVSSFVVALRAGGAMASDVRAAGIPVTEAGCGAGACGIVGTLSAAVARHEPDVVQGWMYHGNLAALLAAARRRPVLWTVRQCADDMTATRWSTAWLIRAGARLSEIPRRVVYNSRESAAQHEAIGYAPARTIVIPNGFDLARWRPDRARRAEVRRELGLPGDAILVGHFARWHASKDHATFLRAAATLGGAGARAHFVLAGAGVDQDNAALVSEVRALGLADRAHLLGPRTDVPRLMPALDLLALSSASEAFPNVVGEAMACAVPCVVTDVGDAAGIVGDTGLVVPPRDPAALARAMARLVDEDPGERTRRGEAARRRMAERYSVDVVARRWEDLWVEVAAERTDRNAR